MCRHAASGGRSSGAAWTHFHEALAQICRLVHFGRNYNSCDWKVLDFAERLPSGAYTDQYPNQTKRLIQAIGESDGTYDLFSVYGDLSAVCISFVGIDPRQLAANSLNKNLTELQGNQPFFTLEGIVTLIVFDPSGGFQIEEIDKDILRFTGGPVQNNTCVNRPSVARILVEPAERIESLAKMTAKIDLR